MTLLSQLIGTTPAPHWSRPWPRHGVSAGTWIKAARSLAAGELQLLSLWGEADQVHMALLERETPAIAVISLASTGRTFPSVGELHPPAIRLERAISDLCGLKAAQAPDTRNWLDHGRWSLRSPLGAKRAAGAPPSPYAFLTVDATGVHEIPVGPVHAGIIEPGHFRFTANGETIVRLEERLGYVHKGIETLMAGATPEKAGRLAGRTSGDSTVAYSLAFAQAIESALALQISDRAVWLRALLAETERIANHLGDFGAICNDASFSLVHAYCGILRERVLRTSREAFGHRLLMDVVVPGGIAHDLDDQGKKSFQALVEDIRTRFPPLIKLYDNTASLQDRTVSTGILKPEFAAQFAAGGFVGRASGRTFDARKSPGYAPYGELQFDVPVRHEGDVNARVWVRIREIEQSLLLIEQILSRLPGGSIRTKDLPLRSGEGMALVESFRGEVFVWLSLNESGRIDRCHLRDPSWFQWPLLEVAVEGNIVADFPLCNKSFNCSYSGHDL